MKSRDFVVLYINGKRHEVKLPHAHMMLADYLRVERMLTGTKIVCAEGDCGACSVLKYYPKKNSKVVVFEPINSCITTVAQCDGSSLVTVDALSNQEDPIKELSPVQEAMVRCNGGQCGFCTPGFVVALTGLAEKKKCGTSSNSITEKEAKNALTGNLCRCTGYDPIIKAATSTDLTKYTKLSDRYYSKEQDRELKKALKVSVESKNETSIFYAPTTLKEAARFLKKYKDSKIFSGGTDLGVQVNKGKLEITKMLSLHLIEDLYKIKISKKSILIGARVTLTELRAVLKKHIPEYARFLDIFASPQIKNTATLIGNLANASPIGDNLPVLLACEAKVLVTSGVKKRKVDIDRFFKGYRSVDLKRGEFIEAVEIQIPEKNEFFKLFKTSQRKDLDISAVNIAVRIAFKKDRKISKALIAMGGVAATPLRLKKSEKNLLGNPLTSDAIEKTLKIVQEEITPLDDLRGTGAFRRMIAENTLRSALVKLTEDTK